MKILRCLCFFMIVMTLFCSASPKASTSKGYKEFTNYFTPLSSSDKKNINFIINTLADKSVFQLMFQKKALEQAGDRVNRVHPLKFLSYIFSNKNLKGKVKNIKGIPWKRFVNDMGNSLTEASKSGEMKKEYIDNFAKTVGVDPSLIEPAIKGRKWNEFIDLVKKRVG